MSKKCVNSKCTARRDEYKMHRNKLTYLKNSAKKLYHRDMIRKNKQNTAKLWQTINNILMWVNSAVITSQIKWPSAQKTSSVARGGSSLPIVLKSMQNSTFLVLLRPIFAPKINAAPPTGLGSGSCEGLAVIWTRILEFFGSGAHPKLVKTFFLEII